MDFRSAFLVAPGQQLNLAGIDPGSHGPHGSEDEASADLEAYKDKISKLQRTLYGDRSKALLIVLQGIDGAGKDGTCWHVISAMDPQGVQVTGFKQPTPEELAHDFLWRVHPHAPAKRRDRRLQSFALRGRAGRPRARAGAQAQWEARYDFINEFERLLYEQNATTILKFFLYISKDEQLERFKRRLDDPARQWKISKADYTERARWDGLHRGVRGGAVEMLDQARALVRDPVEPQVVPQPGGLADHRRYA